MLRDTELDASGKFKKYVLRYWHDAQPRNDGRGAPQANTLISNVEGNSLLMWNTVHDAAATDSNNKLVYGDYGTAAADFSGSQCASSFPHNVVQGNGSVADPEDNYANAWLNHFYIYSDLEGSNPANTSLDKNKIRLGSRNLNSAVQFATVLPQNSGPAFHPMGPGSTPGLQNVLTFSGDTGTVVYTQMKVLENLPVMLTSPRIWEALGLALTPFEDTINFFGDPGMIDASICPALCRDEGRVAQLRRHATGRYRRFRAAERQAGHRFRHRPDRYSQLRELPCAQQIGDSVNSPQNARPAVEAMVQSEIEFWNSYYNIDVFAGDSDWYSKLKGAAISMLAIHDEQHNTSFTANYPGTGAGTPQTTRLGHESVVCQKCHADNVIAVVKSATHGASNQLIPPLTEAVHNNHVNNQFSDSLGRNGSCQGCHPSHPSDGSLAKFPITNTGLNAFASRG